MAHNSSVFNSSLTWTAPGAGDTKPYDPNADSLHIFTCLLTGLSFYNVAELFFMVLFTFKTWHGLYFWSLLISGLGIVPYQLAFFAKYMYHLTGVLKWIDIFLITIGWWTMITGQALVLWSRLHVIMKGEKGEKVVRYTKWMIIINCICLLPITTVFTIGANGGYGPGTLATFKRGFNVVEKIQMCGFFCQEVILSSIYIVETALVLGGSLQYGRRKTMRQLIAVNAIIIVMDLALLGSEAASLYIFEAVFKGLIYSIKLKLEFSILGRLVCFVGGAVSAHEEMGRPSTGFVGTALEGGGLNSGPDSEMDIREFVDLDQVTTSAALHSYISNPSASLDFMRKPPRLHSRGEDFDMDLELDLQRFENVEDVASLRGSNSGESNASIQS